MPQDNEELLRVLIDQYARMYMKMAIKMGVPYEDTEDIVMDAFWSFYASKHFGKLNENETKAMLTRIVGNKCIDWFRKNKYKNALELDEDIGELNFIRDTKGADPLQTIIDKEQYGEIRNYMDSLRENWRDVAIMYFVEGYSIEEISDSLEISGTMCRARLSRVRKHLKEKFRERLKHH